MKNTSPCDAKNLNKLKKTITLRSKSSFLKLKMTGFFH